MSAHVVTVTRDALYVVYIGTGVTILLYIISKHFKRHRVKKFFSQSSVKSGMMTPYKIPQQTTKWSNKAFCWMELLSYIFLRHTWTKLSPHRLCLWDFTEPKKCWLGSQSQFCPNELQIPLRTEIKPLLCTTSSRAALSLQIKLSPYCSNWSYNLCHYICLFAICHYWTEIIFKICVNALLGCYWAVLQIPLF